jgi:hypothetical protein
VTRDGVAARLLAALPGAQLRGSLADGTADEYSDIDVEVPGASAFDDVPAQSAFENAVAAVKEQRRGHPEIARGLLDRGHARIGSPGGDAIDLASAAARLDPIVGRLADQLGAVVTDRPRTPRSP